MEIRNLHVWGLGKSPNEIAKKVKAGKTYYVNVANDDADDNSLKATNGSTADIGKSTPAYYKSGYIKVINVTETSGTTSTTGTTGSTGTQN